DHIADLSPQPRGLHPVHLFRLHENASGYGNVLAVHYLQQRGFPAAGCPQYGNEASLFTPQTGLLERSPQRLRKNLRQFIKDDGIMFHLRSTPFWRRRLGLPPAGRKPRIRHYPEMMPSFCRNSYATSAYSRFLMSTSALRDCMISLLSLAETAFSTFSIPGSFSNTSARITGAT